MFRIYLLVLATFALTFCNSDDQLVPASFAPQPQPKDGDGNGSSQGSVELLVQFVSEKMVMVKLTELRQDLVALDQQARQACGLNPTNTGGVVVAQMRKSWQKAMSDFHNIDVLHYGPMAENAGAAQRGAIMDRIYSWPVVNEFGVDKQVERAHKKQDKYKFKNDKFAQIGMDALEHIFFSRLQSGEEINTNSVECPYLHLLTGDLVAASQEIEGLFKQKQVQPLKTKLSVKTYNEYISQMVQGLQFVEAVVHERKLAAPLAKNPTLKCRLNDNCHLYLEHQASFSSQQALLDNFRFLNLLFSGGPGGYGFFDYLADWGEREKINGIEQDLSEIIIEIAGLPKGEEFFEEVKGYSEETCEEGSLCSVYKRAKRIADWIKGDFILLMSKDIPIPVQGDND
jgi:hypothetical protein